MIPKDRAEQALVHYRLWGIVSISSFILFVSMLLFAFFSEMVNYLFLFLLLFAGFLWIGVTSISRHVFVLLKRHIGKDISVLEFLSTQFIVLLFPFFYMKLRKEVRNYREKEVKADTAEGAE